MTSRDALASREAEGATAALAMEAAAESSVEAAAEVKKWRN